MGTEKYNILNHLAEELVNNHFNVSLFEEKEKAFKQIFNKELHLKEKSRNILIVGAGASSNSHNIFNVANGIIADLYRKLEIENLITTSDTLWKKYIEEARKIANHNFLSDPKEIDRITSGLSFEENLKLLSLIVNIQDLTENLKTVLVKGNLKKDLISITDHIPSLLYEIVAHLFKHRYIDIVINMNFDQMLDNAIEDEMGDSTYHKIIQDSDVKPLSEMIDGDRLRVPIYIKPHGTFRSSSSMKYTVESYLNHPMDLNSLFKDIFSGSVNDDTHPIEKVNFIFLGYSFKDLDIQCLIFEEIYRRSELKNQGKLLEKVNFFIFARTKNSNISNFNVSLRKWIVKENPQLLRTKEHKNYRINRRNDKDPFKYIMDTVNSNIHFIECTDTNSINTGEDNSYAAAFTKVYSLICKKFKSDSPYIPRPINKHILLAKIFNTKFIELEFSTLKESGSTEISKHPEEYYFKLAAYHFIYAFVKFKGKVPMNEIIGSRVGKYNLLYFNFIRKLKPNKGGSLLFHFIETFESENLPILIQDDFLICEKFYNARKTDDDFEKVFVIIKKFIELINGIEGGNLSKGTLNKEELEKILHVLKEDVIFRGSMEINAIYNFPQHTIFHPFDSKCIINTNLELSWKFFNFATTGDWDTLCMIDDNGKPIYNLHSYFKDNCPLEKSGRYVKLYHTNKNPMVYDYKVSDFTSTIEFVTQEIGEKNFEHHHLRYNLGLHKMGLFLKAGKPIFGIYFFKPNFTARINPVCFDNESNLKNLEIMLEIFNNSKPKL